MEHQAIIKAIIAKTPSPACASLDTAKPERNR
jgi:hypothetical protein